jgi:heat shock protein HtpX
VPASHPIGRIFAELRERANLGYQVKLFVAPEQTLNAKTIGQPEEAVVILNAPLIERFTQQEIAGIIAHELGHIQSNDVRFMFVSHCMAELISRMSLLLMIVLLSGFILAEHHPIYSLAGLTLALLLPVLVQFLLAKLSQNREFGADLIASRLLGSPAYLINALIRLENYANASLPPWLSRRSSRFDSHPGTQARIDRLGSYLDNQGWDHTNIEQSPFSNRSAQNVIRRRLFQPSAIS